jgi:hypothetical protein
MRWTLLLFLGATGLMASTDYVRDDFEGPVSAERWHTSGPQPGQGTSSAEVPAFHGARSLRIFMRPGDNRMVGRQGNATERFELTLRESMVNFDQEVWYAFAFRVPATFPRADTRTIIHQFKENVRPIDPHAPPGTKACEKASPAFALYLVGGTKLQALVTSSTACDHTRHRVAERALVPDRWYEVIVRTRPSHQTSGLLELYLDGEWIGEYHGIMGYACHGLGYIDTQPRFGIYRDAHPEVGEATIYYDAIRFAATREGLRLP